MKRILVCLNVCVAALFVISLVLAGCAAPAPAPSPTPTPALTPTTKPTAAPTAAPTTTPTPTVSLPKNIKMTAGADGTELYAFGVAVADVVQRNLGIKVSITPSAGMDASMEALKMGEAELIGSSSMHAYTGLVGAKGIEGFPQYEKMGPVPIRALVFGVPTPMGIVVRGNITKLSDLKGKKIYGNNLGSAGNLKQTLGILEIAGLTAKDVTILDMPSHKQGLTWVAEGKADAVVGATSGANLVEFQAKVAEGRTLSIPIDAKSLEIYNKYYPGLGAYTSPTDLPTMPKGTTTFAVFSFLACADRISEDLAYSVTKVALEKGTELTAIQKKLVDWNIGNTTSSKLFAPFHAGAIKYLKERGVWTSALDQRQKDILSLESGAKAGR